MSGLLLAAFLVLPAAAEEPPPSGLTDWVRKDVADFFGALPVAAAELGSPNLSAGGGVGALDLPPPSWTRRSVPSGDPARSSGAPVVSAADGFFRMLPAQAAAVLHSASAAGSSGVPAVPEPDPASLAPTSPLPVPPADDARAADGTSRAAGDAAGSSSSFGESLRKGGRPAKGAKAPLARPKPFGAVGATSVAPSAIEPTPIRSGRE
ncbi:MAG: hypothetical protein WC969_02085 [Elusimicrobiota bacterium]